MVRQFIDQQFHETLCRSSCLNYLHRLGFVLKRPKKRLLKADEDKRKAFLAAHVALRQEAERTGARIFFVDEAHFRADADLRGKWDWIREDVTAYVCLGTTAKVRARVAAFFLGLSGRTDEVTRRCRTLLQARTDESLATNVAIQQPTNHVDFTVALV